MCCNESVWDFIGVDFGALVKCGPSSVGRSVEAEVERSLEDFEEMRREVVRRRPSSG